MFYLFIRKKLGNIKKNIMKRKGYKSLNKKEESFERI